MPETGSVSRQWWRTLAGLPAPLRDHLKDSPEVNGYGDLLIDFGIPLVAVTMVRILLLGGPMVRGTALAGLLAGAWFVARVSMEARTGAFLGKWLTRRPIRLLANGSTRIGLRRAAVRLAADLVDLHFNLIARVWRLHRQQLADRLTETYVSRKTTPKGEEGPQRGS